MAKKNKPSRPTTAARSPDEEENDLWRFVTSNVTPLLRKKNEKATDTPPPEKRAAPKPEKPENSATARRPPRPAPKPEKPENSATARRPPRPAPELAPGVVSGINKRTAARLKRGQLAIEARIDLHGMVRDEARRELAAFLKEAQTAGRRTVLVITGKGSRPGGGTGVLRAAVPGWLNEAPNRGRLLAFSRARPKDGGEGALYLLLKKKK